MPPQHFEMENLQPSFPRGPIARRLFGLNRGRLVQLNADGSIRSIDVLRTPRFHPHTLQLATQAIRRAAPFGPVGHLPRPWQFSETFLYNDDFKFQLRTLAETP